MNRRDILIDSADEAYRLHYELNSEDYVRALGGGVNVFRSIYDMSIPLLFRPLDKLLGSYLPPPLNGIMITSERNLAIQRFTAAHELGHLTLKHKEISLDDESILSRSPFDKEVYDLNEAAADAFASTFLMPEWVFDIQAERQRWDAESLEDEKIVYQLSLRIGASYEATCRQLARYKLINRTTMLAHLSVPRKKIKQALLPEIELPDWHPNIWVLTKNDEGMLIQGGPNDVFLFQLEEHNSGGYLWDINDLKKSGFVILSDDVIIVDSDEAVGQNSDRIIVSTLGKDEGSEGKLFIKQARAWDQSSVIETLELKYELLKESGLPLVERRASAT